MKLSLHAQIEEVEREIALRKSVYPRLVASGKMRESVAELHTQRMQAVADTLRWLEANEATIKAKVETAA